MDKKKLSLGLIYLNFLVMSPVALYAETGVTSEAAGEGQNPSDGGSDAQANPKTDESSSMEMAEQKTNDIIDATKEAVDTAEQKVEETAEAAKDKVKGLVSKVAKKKKARRRKGARTKHRSKSSNPEMLSQSPYPEDLQNQLFKEREAQSSSQDLRESPAPKGQTSSEEPCNRGCAPSA